ncbi:MAG: PP0621 family protein [Burkholderiaceae bacterium]|nr:PP0621 family protein [Burkholderiaceae bacterium]MCX8003960.1 PP0621 family protein [Burkholderiaceae bacterium]
MGRILFWILLGLAVYVLWRWLAVKQRARRGQTTSGSGAVGEPMVACEVCRLNVPRSEAVQAQGHFFCCDEHRRQALE